MWGCYDYRRTRQNEDGLDASFERLEDAIAYKEKYAREKLSAKGDLAFHPEARYSNDGWYYVLNERELQEQYPDYRAPDDLTIFCLPKDRDRLEFISKKQECEQIILLEDQITEGALQELDNLSGMTDEETSASLRRMQSNLQECFESYVMLHGMDEKEGVFPKIEGDVTQHSDYEEAVPENLREIYSMIEEELKEHTNETENAQTLGAILASVKGNQALR